MSLISEGLKKAQLDAMRQDHQQRRVYFGAARPAVAARRTTPLALMIAIGIGSAVLTGAVILWVRRDDRGVVRQMGVVRASSRASQAAPVARTTTPIEPKPVPPSGGLASAMSVAKEERTPSQPEPKLKEKPKVLEEEPARVTRRDGFIEGETYASPINGPGGIEVTLSGLVGSGDRVLAIINGRSVRAGAMVGPFTVESVEQRRVKLRYVDVHFYLTP